MLRKTVFSLMVSKTSYLTFYNMRIQNSIHSCFQWKNLPFILRTLVFFPTFPLLKRRKCSVLKPCCKFPSIVNNQCMQLMKSTHLLLWRKRLIIWKMVALFRGNIFLLLPGFPSLK